jgi:hypothetical protein
MAGPGLPNISDFLYAHVRGDDTEGLRAEVERHRDRTMTVVFRERVETITRCGICPKEPSRPCTALRVLALPYAEDPLYDPGWQLVAVEDEEPTSAELRPTSVADLATRVQRAYETSGAREHEQQHVGTSPD